MEVHIITLMVWAVATLGICGEAIDDYDNIRNQRDIIRGGIYKNENYAPTNINSDSGSVSVDNNIKNNYQTQTQWHNSYNNNEWTHKPSTNFLGYKNHGDYKKYTNIFYSKDNNMENSFIGKNNEQLNSLYNSYQGDTRTFQNAVINGAKNEVNTPSEIIPVGRIPQSYPTGPSNSYIPIPFSRRIIVPVPTTIPAKHPVYQVPDVPYPASYQVHPSVSYTGKLPIAVPVSVEAAVPNQYPVQSPPPVDVGIQQPNLDLPQSYYISSGNKDIVEYGGNFRNIPNNKSPAVNENVMIYRQPSGYHNAYPGNDDTQFNSLTFGTSQKPVHETFRNSFDYYSYPSPNVSENFNENGSSQTALYNGYIQRGRNYKSMNSNKNMGFRYPSSNPHGRLRQGKALNRNKNIYNFPPSCYFHRPNTFRH